jgi:nucleotide-binding universal stress UspA family protein
MEHFMTVEECSNAGRAASKTERLLVMVDESPGTKRTVDYLAKMIGRRRGFHVCLLHLLPPLPPELLEFGGAENPREEQKLDAELGRDQQAWIAAARNSARPALDDAIKALRKAGVCGREIDLEFSDPMDSRDTAGTVSGQAQAKRCHTIVIGHESHSWFRELAGGHLTEHLLRHAI